MKCKDMLVRRGYIIPRSCSREHTPRRPRSYVREDSEHTSILAKRGYTSILVRREYTSILVRRGYTSILVRREYTSILSQKRIAETPRPWSGEDTPQSCGHMGRTSQLIGLPRCEKKKDGELNCINMGHGRYVSINNNNNIERRASQQQQQRFLCPWPPLLFLGRFPRHQSFFYYCIYYLRKLITYNFGTFLKVFKCLGMATAINLKP